VQSSRILVVDDDASNGDVLERRLVRDGHQVVTAATGTSALELVGKETFNLILLDLIMPEMSGFEVLRRLKAAEHTSHIPVIVISALDELDSAVRCIEAGAEDYLTKPFSNLMRCDLRRLRNSRPPCWEPISRSIGNRRNASRAQARRQGRRRLLDSAHAVIRRRC